MQEPIYNADMYLRLSKEDGDKEESDSIANQRALILDFLNSRPDIRLHKIRVDDGRSGVDFNRPAFTEMLNDIRDGRVNCVIVKDFSRFGRNYIESGRYIQILFPRAGVRFFAVNDSYDSAQVQGYMSHIIVPFKNMVNDAYSADISGKVRSHLDIKRKRGEFVGAFAVYGYAKEEGNKNQLVIDPFAAEVVRDIYKWKLEGLSAQSIADRLNQRGVLSPMEYKRFVGLRYTTTFKVNATARWQSLAVRRILTNAVYSGVLEQGKRARLNYKVRKCADVPPERWICTPNAHEAIIERNVFDTVQEILKQDTRAIKQGKAVFPLSGVVVCADCGGAMVRKTYKKNGIPHAFYVCSNHRADTSFCTTHIVSATEIEHATWQALRLHISAVLDMERALACAEGMAYQQAGVRKLTAQLAAKQDEITRYNGFRLSLHESYREGILNQADFMTFKASYDTKIAEAENAIQLLQNEIAAMALGENKGHDWINKFRTCATAKVLERKIVAELIQGVAVHEGGRIAVTFRYYNEFARLSEVA